MELKENPYWTEPNPDQEKTKATCDCGAEVDIDGPLEDQHFVFALRIANGLERSNLGICPVKHGMPKAIAKMRFYLGVRAVYYQGELI